MIKLTITADKLNGFRTAKKIFYLDDEHDFRSLYDCEVIRNLVEETSDETGTL